MSEPGTQDRPLRVAIVGSGPAGFYTVQALVQTPGLHVAIDMFDRLPTPFGLVRHGVAPDHPKIKSVTAVYHKLASRPDFRFYGNVDFGRVIRLPDLLAHYDQIVFTTGAQTDRSLGIPGEDLAGSHPATEFVAWYNGHPDYCDHRYDLDCERAVVIGVGNVAIDVARILCRTAEELAETDIADPALEALGRSHIREVQLLGRRGPVQAAFTTPEVKELGEMEDTVASTLADEVELDPLSRAELEGADKSTRSKVEILQSWAGRSDASKSRRLVVRFLVSPVEILGDARGHVSGVRIVRNELYRDEGGAIRSRSTERFETIPAGLVFRSVGYRGVPLEGLAFDERQCIVPNERGRVRDAQGSIRTGLYVAGWIKRGPTGVIGTNKPDAAETVQVMLEDLRAGKLLDPSRPAVGAIEDRLRECAARFVSYADWCRLDQHEIERGKSCGRPRVKLTRIDELLAALQD